MVEGEGVDGPVETKERHRMPGEQGECAKREREDGNNVCVCVCVATREEEDRERKVQRCARKMIGSFA